MSEYANKSQVNKSTAVTSPASQQDKHKRTFQFVDNRPEAVAQRKIQDAINNNSPLQHLKASTKMPDNNTAGVVQPKEKLGNEMPQPVQKKENNTGLPDNLKTGVENLSGMSMGDVKVHYNSAKPAQLQAHAYAQGTDIHIAAGQEKHLPHEAWHVAQQKQGRVKATLQMKGGVNINDDKGLEREADEMGTRATKPDSKGTKKLPNTFYNNHGSIQAKVIDNAAGYGELSAAHLVAKEKKGAPATSSLNAPVQKQAWLFEETDKKGEYPVLLMDSGALDVLERFGYRLTDRAQLTALERLLNDPIQRYYPEDKLGAKELYRDILALAQPIATCSFVFRYHDNGGKGALKYDPVDCSATAPMNHGVIDHLRQARGSYVKPEFAFKTALFCGCTNIGRKIMVVPSVGCPEFLKNIKAVMHLQWAAYARQRPTFLLVPQSELETYYSQLGGILKEIGVGLVGWSSSAGLLGFGASRLAAQQFAFSIDGSRREAVLCDVNAIASKEVTDGYDTGDEKGTDRSIKAVKGPGKYSAAGFGTGIPMHDYDPETDKLLKKKNASHGGATRPIEQVVIVGVKMPYDPGFITSSEDADLTNALLAQENARSSSVAKYKYFKRKTVHIEKVAMESQSLSGGAYMSQRTRLLGQLAHEDHILITYRKSEIQKDGESMMVERVVTIGQLAKEIADQHGLNQSEIRSLIVEKIILEAKRRQRLIQYSASSSSSMADTSTGGQSGSSVEPQSVPHHLHEGTPPTLKDVLHRSVMSEAARFGADRSFNIGFADGTDHNCSIISIFKAAGVNISREDAQNYRRLLSIGLGGDNDLTPDMAKRILNLVTEKTNKRYTLYTVQQGAPDARGTPLHGVTELTNNDGANPLFLFFAGTHFSPAWPK
jgi:hypothetical protein